MNIFDYFAITSLSLAIIVNTLTVYLHRTRGIYQRFGKRAWLTHQIIISGFWILPIFGGFGLRYSQFELPVTYASLGIAIMLFALGLFVSAVAEIGTQGLANGNFFGKPLRKLGGIYKVINDPIYLSYAIWYVGLALATGRLTFFIMAGICVIGLMGVESRIEQP